MRNTTWLIAMGLLLGCSSDPGNPLEPDAGSTVDAGRTDAGVVPDASVLPDAGVVDLGCPAGSTFVSYGLAPVDPVPAKQDIDIPNLPSFIMVGSVRADGTTGVRFDVCVGGDGVPRLSALLVTGSSFGAPFYFVVDATITEPVQMFKPIEEGDVVEVRLPPDHFIREGLAEAIAGDSSRLKLRAIGMTGMVVQGHADFVAVVGGDVAADSIRFTGTTLTVGRFVEADPFEGLPCKLNELVATNSFRMGTAQMELDACLFQGAGFTTGYRITRLRIEDTNVALSPAEQMPIEFNTAAEVEAVMNYQWNHHNACDSFHIALSHADYAASTAPAAGCGATVPNAPTRDPGDPPGPALYRLRYNGGAWSEGVVDGCSHYVLCR